MLVGQGLLQFQVVFRFVNLLYFALPLSLQLRALRVNSTEKVLNRSCYNFLNLLFKSKGFM